MADNPYARLTNTIYVGEGRTIFRKRRGGRRNIVALCAFGALCALMVVALVAFSIGKDAGIAEAGPSSDTTAPAEAQHADPDPA